MTNPPPHTPEILMPDTQALVVGVRGAYVLDSSGEILSLSFGDAARRLRQSETPPIVCHARRTAQRLGLERMQAFDVLELFAFAKPAEFCLPTALGLAQALGLALPHTHED
ncbi:ATP-dependent DNA helicase, partial [Pseudomonadota bacterium]